MKIIYALVSLLCSIVAPISAMETTQTSLFCSLDAPILEKIASSTRWESNTIAHRKIVLPILDWKDIISMQQVCKQFHDNFYAADKTIQANFKEKRDSLESVDEFFERVFHQLTLIAKYPHAHKIALNLACFSPHDGNDYTDALDKFIQELYENGIADRIIALSLADNNLQDLPNSLLLLSNLERLNLDQNLIAHSANALKMVFALPSLKQLSLAANAITQFPNITTKTKIEGLDLSDNNLQPPAEPIQLGSLRKTLKSLFLGGNNIHTLPQEILELENLKMLDLGDNYLSEQELEKLERLQNIETLYMQLDHLHHIPNILFMLPRLIDLDLSYNILEEGELSKLCNITMLERLSLHGPITTIPIEFRSLKNLKALLVASDGLSPLTEIETICEIPNLEYLAVDDCNLHSLPSQIQNLTKLKCLSAIGNHFEGDALEIIMSLLPVHCKMVVTDKDLQQEVDQVNEHASGNYSLAETACDQ